MNDTHTKTADMQTEGSYCGWKELRPFKYCMVKPRMSQDEAPPTIQMDRALCRAFVSAAYRHRIKDGNLIIDKFLHEMYDQVLSENPFYKGRLYEPKEVVENLFKIRQAFPDLLKGARPSYAEIARALGIPDTYTHDKQKTNID